MKKILYILLMALVFVSCEKDEIDVNLYGGEVLYTKYVDAQESFKDFPYTNPSVFPIIDTIQGLKKIIRVELIYGLPTENGIKEYYPMLFSFDMITTPDNAVLLGLVKNREIPRKLNIGEFDFFDVKIEYTKSE